ncbi:MAG TPA: 4a-hydroxytetrahydrobiopterin dehydratase [Acidobacteriota bacterium]|nr:4a-hydroxytetrahydrobiopterin dehydratase [Acidobacteriota bacterium]
MARLTDEALARELPGLPGWAVEDGMLRKAFRHPSFPEAIVFVNAVAHLAEAANHHPDVDIRYSTITISLVTHDAGGITGKDVALAREIEDVRKRAGIA